MIRRHAGLLILAACVAVAGYAITRRPLPLRRPEPIARRRSGDWYGRLCEGVSRG